MQIDGLRIYWVLKFRAGTYGDDWWHIAILAHFASSQPNRHKHTHIHE